MFWRLKPLQLYLTGAVLISIGVGTIIAVTNVSKPRPVVTPKRGLESKVKPVVDLSSVETALESYIRSLKLGDREGVLQCYNRKGFELSKPVPIKSYQVLKKFVFTAEKAGLWNTKGSAPDVQAGDVRVQIKATYQAGPDPYQDEQTEIFSYYFRNTGGRWIIFGHQLGPQG